KVEGTAEALAQGQSPGLVHAAAERRVNDELHPAAFVKEALSDDGLLRRHFAQHSAAGDNVFDQLLRRRIIEAGLVLQPGDGALHLGTGSDPPQTESSRLRRN